MDPSHNIWEARRRAFLWLFAVIINYSLSMFMCFGFRFIIRSSLDVVNPTITLFLVIFGTVTCLFNMPSSSRQGYYIGWSMYHCMVGINLAQYDDSQVWYGTLSTLMIVGFSTGLAYITYPFRHRFSGIQFTCLGSLTTCMGLLPVVEVISDNFIIVTDVGISIVGLGLFTEAIQSLIYMTEYVFKTAYLPNIFGPCLILITYSYILMTYFSNR